MKSKVLKNKLYAILLTIIGLISAIVDEDATFLVLVLCIAIPLFFAKDCWIY